MNRTIMEKVRSMISMAKLPKPFWGEAVRVACYLINRSPSVPLNFEIPEKVWSGKNPSYSHLRVFGCLAFVHVSKEQRQKLDARTTPSIFIGYGDEEFGYRLWDPKEKKVIRSRDVVFYENQILEDIEKSIISSNSRLSAQDIGPVPSPAQFIIGNEEIPEAEHEEEVQEFEQGEQGELQPSPSEVAQPSQVDDGTHPQIGNSEVRRCERGWIPSTRYSESEYILLSEEGEPESFQEEVSHELVKLQKGKKALRNTWVFKCKKDGSGKVVKQQSPVGGQRISSGERN